MLMCHDKVVYVARIELPSPNRIESTIHDKLAAAVGRLECRQAPHIPSDRLDRCCHWDWVLLSSFEFESPFFRAFTCS